MYDAYLYKKEKGLLTGLSQQQMAEAIKDPECMLWVDFEQIDDIDIDIMTNIFGMHPLTVEDCIMPNIRPKAERFKDYLFLIMFAMEVGGAENKKMRTVELDCLLGKNFVITAHSDTIPQLDVIKDRLKKQSPIIIRGPDFFLYSITDSIVDSYFPIIDIFDSKVDMMSDELFKDPTQETLRKIYNLKNEIILLRRTIGPQADVVGLIVRGDFELINQMNIVYFRNVHDNLVRLNDIVGTSRDIITSALEAYVSVISNRLNEIMKTLTVIATIMMPLTLIASIYGMNFKHMPELSHRYGYPFALALMFVITFIMLVYFKRKRWL